MPHDGLGDSVVDAWTMPSCWTAFTLGSPARSAACPGFMRTAKPWRACWYTLKTAPPGLLASPCASAGTSLGDTPCRVTTYWLGTGCATARTEPGLVVGLVVGVVGGGAGLVVVLVVVVLDPGGPEAAAATDP